MKQMIYLRQTAIAAALLLCSVFCQAQKIGKNKYNKVDTVYEYSNAIVVIYKVKNVVVRDTIWLTKQNSNWHINQVDELNILNDEKLKRGKSK